MNWLKLIVFLIFIIYYYHLFGTEILSRFKLENKSFAKKILVGFIGLTSIQWCVGFPSQVFHVSWNIYFFTLLSIYLLLFVFLFKKYKIKKFSKHIISSNLKIFLRKYWFVIFLTLSFAFWSMSSQLPYFLMNYDDHYYLSAIIQQIGSDALSTVNYFNGTPMDLGITRLINTFEINYGFWCSLFQMDVAFFARATMVVHNYFMIFIAIFAFGETFKIIKPDNLQYILLPFSIFLLPSFYVNQKLGINLYDGWQINTAIWYGGSLVRIISLPVCIMYLREVLDDFNWKKIFYIMMPFFAFISFSSIFVPIAVVTIGFGILYAIWIMYNKHKDKKHLLLTILALVIILVGIKLGPKALELIKPSLINLYESSGHIWSQVDEYSKKNYLFVLLSISMIIFYKKWHNEPFHKMSLITCGICVILYCGYFNKFIIIICTGYDFVVYRLVTSVQIFLLILCSIIFNSIICSYINKKIIGVCAISFAIFINVINYRNLNYYCSPENAYLGSGVSIYGYSPTRLLKNTHMTPNFYVDFSDYFDTLESGRYRIISPQVIRYEEGTLFLGTSLASIANNVESCVSLDDVRCDNIVLEDIGVLTEFAEGNRTYDDAKPLLQKHKISYVITTNPTVKDDVIKQEGELVVESFSLTNESIYLLKLN